MARARVQHRHGTFSNYKNNKTTILNDEIVVVDSGHPDTPDGSALYYRPSGASEPVRVANAGELPEAGINVETVTESQLSNATGDNIYLCLINSRWHKVICVSGSSTRAQYAISAYHNFIYRWQSKSGDSWGQWTDWSPIGIADNIRDGAIALSKLGADVLEQLANKGVRIITPEESQGWDDEIPLTFAGELYDIAGWNEYLWFLYDIPSSDTYRWVKLIDDDTLVAQMQLKENTANKAKAITEKNKNSTTLFPTVGAVNAFVIDKIATINSMIDDLEARISNLE